MSIAPSIMFGSVMHKRLAPKVNAFTYGIYYIALPLSRLGDIPMPHNRFGFVSFHDRDHGSRDGSDLLQWARDLLAECKIRNTDGEIVLLTMPRVFGYVFNPVSFWLCHDKRGNIRAVLCEVNNTFGETHTYVCAHGDGRIITADDLMEAEKVFHVSPFLERKGEYGFRFDIQKKQIRITIDHYDAGEKILLTALGGRLAPLEKAAMRRAFTGYPLITLKAILLIHMQAVKLFLKGVKYVSRPRQKCYRFSGVIRRSE